MRFLYVCILIAMGVSAVAADDPARVVVLANRRVPESVALARYYMDVRGIPASNLCVLNLPTGEQMSRQQYVRELRDPLLAFLREEGLVEQVARPANEVEFHETPWLTVSSQVDYLVSVYGVPVRIGDTRFRLVTRITDRLGKPQYKNMAAVDSELALLLASPYDISGARPNPVYRALGFQSTLNEQGFLLVAARLDGPDPAAVRRQIDDALWTERYGMMGRMYFDTRGLTSGPYFLGDYWIREARELFSRAGFETVLGTEPDVWDETYPMEDAVLYLGWYTEHIEGPFNRPDFVFQPGTIAYHLHSGSAVRFRQRDRYWTGPLLARGAAASMGAVSEPFLTFTPNLKVFAQRLLQGHSFGRAALMSQSVLSWQITFVGDPLYRPFRYSLSQQMEHLRADERPEIEWAHVRHANILIQQGRFNIAMNYLRAALRERESLVIRERLADLYVLNDLVLEAGREYERILQKTESPYTAARVGARWMTVLRALGNEQQADQLKSRLNREWERHPALKWLEQH